MQAGKNILQKRTRVQGRRSRPQRHKSVVLSAAAPQDVIDVEAKVVDNRIPVTVSEDFKTATCIAQLEAKRSLHF